MLLSFGDVSKDSVLNKPWPVTFLRHAELVFNGPVVASFFIIGTISAIVFVQKRERRLLTMWTVLVFVLYLNPVVAPFIIKYVTSPNIYWGLVLPAPFSARTRVIRSGPGIPA